MPWWLAAVLAGCAVAISIGIVLVLLSVRRAVHGVTAILAATEREVAPTVAEARGLTSDARGLTQEATRELRRVGDVVEGVHETTDGVARIVNAVAGITRAGQVVAVAGALRRGVNVFVHQMRKDGGNHHGQ
jgi:uncharacterized protein YoxC